MRWPPAYLGGSPDALWLTGESDGQPIGLVYCQAERLTDRSWNMLAIAVQPELQGQGIGARIVADLEQRLRDRGARILIVETSGLPDYAPTRQFYAKAGYAQEARIRDFYADGDDKVVFWKALTPTGR